MRHSGIRKHSWALAPTLISETPPLLKWVDRTVITSLTRRWKPASPVLCLVFTVKVEAMSPARHVVVLWQKSWSMTVKCVWTASVSLTIPEDIIPLQTWSEEFFKGTDMYIGLHQWFRATGLLFSFSFSSQLLPLAIVTHSHRAKALDNIQIDDGCRCERILILKILFKFRFIFLLYVFPLDFVTSYSAAEQKITQILQNSVFKMWKCVRSCQCTNLWYCRFFQAF